MTRSWMCVAVTCVVAAFIALARGGETPSLKLSEDEVKLLELTNAERKKKEIPSLRPNPLLCHLARAHSANMARQAKMEHVLDGKTPFDRLREAGYTFLRGGENIAACPAATSLAEVMRAWMESKGHRENILSPDYTEIGVGLARDANGHVYYTQVFARPRGKE